MSATAQKCQRCEAVLFPARLLCPGCGGNDFGHASLNWGTIEQRTTLSDGTILATVLSDDGPRLIARIDDEATGERVSLTHDPAAGLGQAYIPNSAATTATHQEER